MFPALKGVPAGYLPVLAGGLLGCAVCAQPLCRVLNRWLAWPSTRTFLAGILFLGLILRLLALVVFPQEPMTDPRLYHRYAISLLEDGSYGQVGYQAFYPPGMTLILAGGYWPT